MRVHRHRDLAESGVEHNVSGFAPDARQRLECFSGLRYFTVVQFHQHAAGFDHVFGFAVVEADGLDVLGKPLYTQFIDGLWRVGYRVEPGSRLIDAYVGGLGGKDDGYQQFERRGVGQFGFWVRIVLMQPAKDFLAFCGIHGRSFSSE